MIIVSSTSMKLASLNCIAFSSQTSYLIIENLYHKQKALLVKIEEELKTRVLEIKVYLEELEELDAKKAAIVIQKAMKSEVVAALKSSSKTIFSKFLKLFKSEEFASKFSSTSMKQCLESAIQSSLVKKASISRQKTAEQEVAVVSFESVIQSSLTKKAVIEARKAVVAT